MAKSRKVLCILLSLALLPLNLAIIYLAVERSSSAPTCLCKLQALNPELLEYLTEGICDDLVAL
jgi:hypothetical protein